MISKGRVILMSMSNDIERTEDYVQRCLAIATEITKIREAIQVWSLFFLWTGTTKSRVSFVLEQTERSVETHCQTHDTDI